MTLPELSAKISGAIAGKVKPLLDSKQDELAVTGAANKGVYISTSGVVSPMTYELNANVPANFAPATAAPLMDGTAAVGTSAKYAREDHRHDTDTSRASATDFAALRGLISRMEIYCEASDNPATFSDAKAANVKALSVTITPTQSGSGDPYPPGGGKNLLNSAISSSATVNGVTFSVNSSDGTITANGTATGGNAYYYIATPTEYPVENVIISGCPQNGGASSYCAFLFRGYTNNEVATDIGNGANVVLTSGETYRYAIRIFNGYTAQNLKFYPMIRRASDTDPTFAPYSNIRPISGVSSVTVTRTGKNLLSYPNCTQTVNGVTAVSADGVVTLSGTATALTQFAAPVRPPLPAGTYILTGCPEGGSLSTYDLRIGNSIDTGSGASITTAEALYITVRQGINVDGLTFRPMIRLASETDTAFEAYRGQAVTVTLTDGSNPLTVYGGTLDVTTGTLTVDRQRILISSQAWATRTIYSNDMHFVSFSTNPVSNTGVSSCYPAYSSVWESRNHDFGIVIGSNEWESSLHTAIRDSRFSTVTDFVAAMGDQSYVIPIAPATYQLTPAQVATLSGYNVVFSDAGTVDVTYKADASIVLGGG